MTLREIPNTDGLYLATKEGEIVSTSTFRYLFKDVNDLKRPHKAYYRVTFFVKGVKKRHLVHRLIAETFIPKSDGRNQVNHKDGNRLNNRLENLEWCTQKENSLHSTRVLKKRHGSIGKLVLDTLSGIYYSSIEEAAKAKNFKRETLGCMLRGVHPNKSSCVFV